MKFKADNILCPSPLLDLDERKFVWTMMSQYLIFYYSCINKFFTELIWQPLILVCTNLYIFCKALLAYSELILFFFTLTAIINHNSKRNQNLECCFTQKLMAEGSGKV